MITRAIDTQNDWIFGTGKESYFTEQSSVGQNIKTRLQSFFNDCFFDLEAGIDWFSLLGSRNQSGLKNAVAKAILSTTGVYSIDELVFSLSENRDLLVQYQVTTLWSEKINSSLNVG
jgi:hypothetical protein